MSSLLVTGGAGFIGSNFIRLLSRETDYRVVNLDLLTYAGWRENLADLEGSSRYRFVHGDIADGAQMQALLASEPFAAIVSFAAESHVDRSIHDPAAFVRSNLLGVQVLLEAARRAGLSRFIQISTDEVYGDLDEDAPRFSESSPLRPSSPYAASKAGGDLLALAAFRSHRLPVIITRCSNNYGPYQHPEKFVALTIQRALAGEPIPVYGSGRNIRDWIHVEDHCRGVLAALERGRPGEVYNLGGDSERRNLEVATAILRALGRPDQLLRFVTDRPGHDLRYAIDFSKARRELGFAPRIGFEDGLRQTIEWYRANPEWLRQRLSAKFREFCDQHYGEIR